MAVSNKFLAITLTLLVSFATPILAQSECGKDEHGECHDKSEALKLKLIAIAAILLTSMIGVCLPLFSRAFPALQPDKKLFVLVKAFASGIILATGYMHVLPDSFDDLTSDCLPETPWHKFPFSAFVAMLSAVSTLMVDSFSMTYYRRKMKKIGGVSAIADVEVAEHNFGHSHGPPAGDVAEGKDIVEGTTESQLLRYRVVAQVLELGIIVHSVVIGLSMGASNNVCTIRPLVAALCFHQMFEGMGLGGCIAQAEYGLRMKSILVFFFSSTTPFGIALGIGLSNVYVENSPTALIVVGLLNACSAGLLHYMALVDLLAADFMGPRLQKSMSLQAQAYVCVLFGIGGMSLLAKWA